MSVLLRVAAALLVVYLLTRVIVYGVTDIYLASADAENIDSIQAAEKWSPDNPRAQYFLARDIQQNNAQAALESLHKVLWFNPADARAMVLAAEQALEQGNKQQADKLMDQAVVLMPANKSVRLRAANYWLEQKDLQRAIKEWSIALAIDPRLGDQIYPIFLQIVEHAPSRQYIFALAENKPAWWSAFYQYFTSKSRDDSAVVSLAEYRIHHGGGISSLEKQALLKRLIDDGRWELAYLFWVEGMQDKHRKLLAPVYDGSFEGGGDEGVFGWQLTRVKGAASKIHRTKTPYGNRALYLKFYNRELIFQHVKQNTLLPPGHFRISFYQRSDGLKGRGRLSWVVRCAGDKKEIGRTQPLVINREWRPEEFEIVVPDETACKAQMLRLESQGKHPFDHKMKGGIWFDHFQVQALNEQQHG